MNLTQQEWRAKLDGDKNAVILDVRTKEETMDGVIPNAINFDIYKGQGFIYEIDQLDKSKNYYVYCKAGSRSEQACNIMNELGFVNTFNLIRGMSQWNGEITFQKE